VTQATIMRSSLKDSAMTLVFVAKFHRELPGKIPALGAEWEG